MLNKPPKDSNLSLVCGDLLWPPDPKFEVMVTLWNFRNYLQDVTASQPRRLLSPATLLSETQILLTVPVKTRIKSQKSANKHASLNGSQRHILNPTEYEPTHPSTNGNRSCIKDAVLFISLVVYMTQLILLERDWAHLRHTWMIYCRPNHTGCIVAANSEKGNFVRINLFPSIPIFALW
jgi:hypothetical protein